MGLMLAWYLLTNFAQSHRFRSSSRRKPGSTFALMPRIKMGPGLRRDDGGAVSANKASFGNRTRHDGMPA